jgi:adenylate cyclase
MPSPSKAVFLSYASQDAATAHRVRDTLQQAGIEVWLDQSELRGGDAWDDTIRRQIRECALFLPLISVNTESRSEGYFRLEWKLAVERSHLMADDLPFLVPLVIDSTLEAAARVPDRFRERQWTRLSNGQLPHEVVERLGRLLADTPAPHAPSTTPAQPATAAAHRLGVCVLPFANMSGDTEQEYFSDGISEDVITDLSKVSALWVAARNTAFTFKGKHVDVLQVARQLKVTHVLEGSVRKAGNRVRITAQLIDGASGGHVWAERYDRDLKDIFALQDEISQAIVAALKLKLLPEEKQAIQQRGTSNAEAYKLYLMARQYSLTGNIGAARHGEIVIRLCQRATEIDPSYARAWALMAGAQGRLRMYQGRGEDGLAAAERALALDPNLAEAHAQKALVASRAERHDEAQREVALALKLDPECYEANLAAGTHYYALRRFSEAIPYYDKAASMVETDYLAPGMCLSCHRALGEEEAAHAAARVSLARAEAAVALEPDNGSAMGYIVGSLAVLGERERTKEWIERATLLDPDNLNMRFNFACALVSELQEFDAALDLLEPNMPKLSTDALNWMKIDPDLDALREHPRFKAMVSAAEARFAQRS